MEAEQLDLTYDNYKVATSRLTEWLVVTAREHGMPEREVKLKRNIFAQPTCSFKNSDDYRALAVQLSSCTKPGVMLPPTLAVVIRQAIRLREVQAQKYPVDRGHGKRNKTHRHFVEELKGMLRALESTVDDPDLVRSSSSTLCTSDIVSAVWPPSTKREVPPLLITLDGQLEDSQFDKGVTIGTFFEDMETIRNSIVETWEEYAAGRLCLTAAAITTDTAFKIMKSSCEEICRVVPDVSTWPGLAASFRGMLSGPPQPTTEEDADFLDWTCAKVAFRLHQFCKNLKPGHILIARPERINAYDPTRDRTDWSIGDQDIEDAEILSELLMDILVLFRNDIVVPAQDELTAGLRLMMEDGSFEAMPMYVIFAAQSFLDIHHRLRGGISQSFNNLQCTGKMIRDIVDEYIGHARDRGEAILQDAQYEPMEVVQDYVKNWLEQDIIGAALSKGADGRATIPPFRLLRNHAVLCGLKVFRLQILLQEIGIGLLQPYEADCSPSDGRTSTTLSTYTHRNELFSGRAPSFEADYFDRSLLTLTEHQRKLYYSICPRKTTASSETLGKSIKLKITTPIRDIFLPRYVQEGPAKITQQNVVAMASVASKRSRTSLLTKDTAEFLHTMIEKRRYTTGELLRVIREGVAAEEMHLLFDYIGFHERIIEFVGRLYQAFQLDLNRFFGHMDVANRDDLALVITGVFGLVRDSDPALDRHRDMPLENMLDRLASVFSHFISEEGEDRGRISFRTARVLTNTIMAELNYEYAGKDG